MVDQTEEKSEKKKSNASYYIIGVLIIIIIAIIIYFSFFRLDVNIKSDKILRCSDGTVYDSCSTSKPSYCSNGTILDNPIKCGCSDGLVVAGNLCKNPLDLLPDSNFSCSELAPTDLSVRFGFTGFPAVSYPAELIDTYNALTNNVPLKNVPGKYCLNHLPAKSGENIEVINLFYCYGFSSIKGGVDTNGTVKKSYKISYEFVMDRTNCTNLSVEGTFKKCNVNSVDCSWNFTN